MQMKPPPWAYTCKRVAVWPKLSNEVLEKLSSRDITINMTGWKCMSFHLFVVCSPLSVGLSLSVDIFAPLIFAPVCWERLRAGQEQMGCWQPSFTQLGWAGTWVGVLISTNQWMCMCVCVCAWVWARAARGTIDIIISAWEAHLGGDGGWLEGWHGEAEFNNGPTTGFVCTEQRADKCRLLLSIYTLLHSPAHVHLTQKCTHSDALAVALVCFFASLSPSKTHRLTHSYRHTHAACLCLQCISVSVSLRVRGNDRKAPVSTSVWQKPGHYVTLQARLWEYRNWGREEARV